MDTSYRISFWMRWAGLIVSVATFYYLSKLVGGRGTQYLNEYGGDYFSFVLIGLTAMSFLNAGINGLVGSVSREQWSGTLEVLFTVPVPQERHFLYFSMYNFIMGSVAAGLYLFLGNLCGVTIKLNSLATVATIVILSTIIFHCLGVIAGACVMVFKRGDPLSGMATNLLWLLGGAYFPVNIFPSSIQMIAAFLPSTYIVRALRLSLLKGYSFAILKDDIVILILFCLIFGVISRWILRWAIQYARKRGTIAFY